MQLGKVIGTVVASRKEDILEGMKFLLVKGCDFDGQPNGSVVVAVDAVGAGVGEVILYASGSSARLTHMTENRPVDATIMAIVDAVDVGSSKHYRKNE